MRMKKIVKLKAAGSILISFLIVFGCLALWKEKTNKTDGTYTLCIYMCGSDLETKRGAASKNIDELLAAHLPENVQIILQTGGASSWRRHNIPSDSINRWKIEKGELVLLEQLPQANMGNGRTLADFLIFCANEYPKSEQSVILWDHGGGSARGICCDENYQMDIMRITELDEALDAGRKLLGRKYAFVGYDLCLGANLDTAIITARYAENMIASQEIESMYGWDYKKIAERLGTSDFYEKMMEAYADKCMKKQNYGYTISHIRLDLIKEVEEKFQKLVRLMEEGKENKWIVDAASDAIHFGMNTESEGYSEMIDLGSFAGNLGFTELNELLGQSITTMSGKMKRGVSGLSIYYPVSGVSNLYTYLENTPVPEYADFLKKNYGEAVGGKMIVFTDSGSAMDGELHIQLSTASLKYVQRVEYEAYYYYTRADGYSRWISYGADTDVKADKSGGFTSSFKGRWIQFGGEFICCYPIDKRDDISTFAATCRVNGQAGTVRFTYDSNKRRFHTLGFISTDGNQISRMEMVDPGDEWKVMFYELLSDGTKQLCDGIKGGVYTGKEKFSVADVPDGDYQTRLVVTDIYGGKKYSKVAHVKRKDGKQYIVAISEEVWTYTSETVEK